MKTREILHVIDVDVTASADQTYHGSHRTSAPQDLPFLQNLDCRFWDVDSGSVKIAEGMSEEYTLESLMSRLSIWCPEQYIYLRIRLNNNITVRPSAGDPCGSSGGGKESLLCGFH